MMKPRNAMMTSRAHVRHPPSDVYEVTMCTVPYVWSAALLSDYAVNYSIELQHYVVFTHHTSTLTSTYELTYVNRICWRPQKTTMQKTTMHPTMYAENFFNRMREKKACTVRIGLRHVQRNPTKIRQVKQLCRKMWRKKSAKL